ncbi:MAG: hypothetical protein A2W90_14575 [Bacteroidetes bacterium GWF2_42_66]|nr:MAG: hypothetical protein A2W92_15970 [Bacteroidetes bacterium GWA2_42_15]OFX99080.1 MAG: hypothetical protein A2W89_06685 [Bacteroidetes bacterium GWE2_42_39]OFY46751.1 MAG: hypothetical protein A2W90_14575 [Bacteroidetes bacterium GWF2_42_66]HAZ00698.1 hypothetical protein [Marinilabiliales bacterium]HBL73842.1 hypothetical protein [Prolixibacteraceae bacterium]
MTVEKNEKQTMSLRVTEGLTVTILPDSSHEFLMSSKDVATGYGVSEGNIRNQLHRNKEEFHEGKHFGTAVCFSNSGLQSVHNKVFWTKRGIVRLGFFIKSDRARLFRDWAEDLILDKVEKKQDKPAVQLSGFQQHSLRLQQRYTKHPEFSEMWEAIESAIIACGSANELSRRLGINASVFSLIKKSPWLVSEEKQKAITLACRNLIARNAKVDTETIEQLLQIEDTALRMSLFTKMRKGGLL